MSTKTELKIDNGRYYLRVRGEFKPITKEVFEELKPISNLRTMPESEMIYRFYKDADGRTRLKAPEPEFQEKGDPDWTEHTEEKITEFIQKRAGERKFYIDWGSFHFPEPL